jgi:hypothetical protein
VQVSHSAMLYMQDAGASNGTVRGPKLCRAYVTDVGAEVTVAMLNTNQEFSVHWCMSCMFIYSGERRKFKVGRPERSRN